MTIIQPDAWASLVADPPDWRRAIYVPSGRGVPRWRLQVQMDKVKVETSACLDLVRLLPKIPSVLGVAPLPQRKRTTYAKPDLILACSEAGVVSLNVLEDPECSWVGLEPGLCSSGLACIYQWLAERVRGVL